MSGISLIPTPQSCIRAPGTFLLSSESRIFVDEAMESAGTLLAQRLRPATGYLLPVIRRTAADSPPRGDRNRRWNERRPEKGRPAFVIP
jgi:hypothetical protein